MISQNQPIEYLFIDGECLNRTLSKLAAIYFEGERPPLSWVHVRNFNRKVFYYDAIPVQNYQEDDNSYSARTASKRSELAFIERQPAVHVRTGDARYRKRRGNEQKMVDVQFAVDALLMASRGLFTTCTLVTGDLDFKPLIVALVDMGIDVRLLYPQDETNEELLSAADFSEPLNINYLSRWINAEFSKKERIPNGTRRSNFKWERPSSAVYTWDDAILGRCYVAENEHGYFSFCAEFDPLNPNVCSVEVENAPDLNVLRHYVYACFGISIPEW